ncbi:MAG: CPBP family intramembrane metalloprotease [Bacteroidaceae bacterium]|nr:CPBP family intramembrane metalloprotease [Bacteroidaceae bacterium]
MWTIVKLVLYYFGYQLGFSAIAMAVSRFVVPMDMTLMTSVAMVASTLMMMWHLVHFRYVRIQRDRYKEVSRQVLFVSVVFVFAAMYVLNLLIEQVGIPNTMEDTFIAMSRNPFGLLSIALLAPVLEEMLFRGAIEGRLLRVWQNPWAAIVVSSLIFGIVHMNPAQIPFAFLLGMMFGWLYYRTGSLLPGIIGHVLNNSVAAVNMILYADATLEEQVQDVTAMWLWAAVATAAFVLAALWLHRRLGDKQTTVGGKEADGENQRDSNGYLQREK